MTVLRLFAPPLDSPQRWQWALVGGGARPVGDGGSLSGLPPELLRLAERIQLVLPAPLALITRAKLPSSASRHSGSLLAYAIEETTASDPEANQVSWLGPAGGEDVLAVVDRTHLGALQDALGAAGFRDYAVTCESLLLPWQAGRWSCAWDGTEGFVRTGELEGAAADCGDRHSPPLSLCLMIEAAKARNEAPAGIDLYPSAPDKAPDVAAWQRVLGVAINPAPSWNWRLAPPDAGIDLALQPRRWRLDPRIFARLRPAAWIAVAALGIHAAALAVDWSRLAAEQRSLRSQMETRFRSLFPDALAVADPGLQMRRKLAEVRRAANKPDDGDFAVMIAKATLALKALPAGALQAISYESGRMTLEFAADDPALAGRVSAQLAQAGLLVATAMPSGSGRRTVTLTLRAP